MKKLLALVLSLAMVLSLAACGSSTPTTEAPATAAPTTAAPTTAAPTTPAPTTAESTTQAPATQEPATQAPSTEAPTTEAPAPTVMSYGEFMAAKEDEEVTIQATVQLAAYNAENKNASLFMADEDGAYFIYRMNVDDKDVELLKEGTVLRISGYKTIWSGEVEIKDVTAYEAVKDAKAYMAKAEAVTPRALKEGLEKRMNARALFENVTIIPSAAEDGKEQAFLYQWNGSGQEGDDIYFKARLGEEVITFVVESDEFGPDTAVYKAVQALEVDEVVNLEAFLYWYEGPQPHVCALSQPSASSRSEDSLSFAQFQEAEFETEVTIEGFIQLMVYSRENGHVSLFLEDVEGSYFVFRMNVTPEEAAEMTLGRRIKIAGFKSEWSGEVEITDGKFELGQDYYLTDAVDVTPLFSSEELLSQLMNSRVAIKNAVVAASLDADEKEQPFLYKANGSGEDGDDLYFTVTIKGQNYVLCVESDEWPAGSEVYEAVKALQIGDAIDLEGFLYWFNGPQPHIYSVKESETPPQIILGFEEFLLAKEQTEVTIDAYVQLASYNEEKGLINLFLGAPLSEESHAGYYVYNMAVTPEEAESLVIGAHVLVTGYKAVWSGEIEITEARFELLGGDMFFNPVDITNLFTENRLDKTVMNTRFAVIRAIVMPSQDSEEKEVPFLYKRNGSGEEGDDLYVTLLVGGRPYTMLVESDEFGPDTEVYQAVQSLQIGDMVNLEGFLYWYNGPQPHLTTVRTDVYTHESEDITGFGRYYLAQKDEAITLEGMVSLRSSYWEEEGQGLINLYVEDNGGSYYIYKLPVTPEEAEAIEVGTPVRIRGFKTEWSGMTEIVDASMEILEGTLIMDQFVIPLDNLLAEEDLSFLKVFIAQEFSLKAAVIVPSQNAEGEEVPFLYKWNGSGEEGDDIYFNVRVGEKILTVTVESSEFDKDSGVYQAAQALRIGDVVDLSGFLYWYEGPQPHIADINDSAYRKLDGAVTYYEYLAAEKDEAMIIDAYIQGGALVEKDGQLLANLFLHDRVGAYYVYGVPVLEEDAEFWALSFGRRIAITGYRDEWSGEIEVTGVESYEIIENEEDIYYAPPVDITEKLADEEYITARMNHLAVIRGAEVVASTDSDGKDVPFLYKWNGSGQAGDDIYFKVKVGDMEWTLTIESDEVPLDSMTYEAAQEMKIGDKLDITAFLYFYEGPQPHVQSLEPAADGE